MSAESAGGDPTRCWTATDAALLPRSWSSSVAAAADSSMAASSSSPARSGGAAAATSAISAAVGGRGPSSSDWIESASSFSSALLPFLGFGEAFFAGGSAAGAAGSGSGGGAGGARSIDPTCASRRLTGSMPCPRRVIALVSSSVAVPSAALALPLAAVPPDTRLPLAARVGDLGASLLFLLRFFWEAAGAGAGLGGLGTSRST